MPRGEIGEARRADVIRMRVEGMTVTEIADHLGVAVPVVSRTLSSPDVRAAVQARNADLLAAVQDSFVNAQILAWRVMTSLLRSKDERIRIMAAKDILDRGPMVRGAAVDITGSGVEGELAALSVAQLRALVGEEDVVVLDVTPSPEAK